MLTTQDSTKLSQSIVTDVNANVPIDPGPARTISPEAALLFNKSVVARPLMVPEICSVKIKRTEYRYRWVNRDGQNGRIYMQRKAQGFTNATNEDVELLGGDVTNKDGEIRAGDLILMKIPVDQYDAAIKWNMQKAVAQSNMRGVYQEGGSSDPFSDSKPARVSVSNEPFSRSGLAKPFIPENPDALINDSIASGRVEKTRETVEALRKK